MEIIAFATDLRHICDMNLMELSVRAAGPQAHLLSHICGVRLEWIADEAPPMEARSPARR